MSLRISIGSAIKEARILEGITREELAERIGIDEYDVINIENGCVLPVNKRLLSISDYETILSKLKYGECYKLVNTKPHLNPKLQRLGELNMIAALGKITDEQEVERKDLQREFPTESPTGFENTTHNES